MNSKKIDKKTIKTKKTKKKKNINIIKSKKRKVIADKCIKVLFIPGKKNTHVTNIRLKNLILKNVPKKFTFFDYRSESKLSDTIRLVWDTVGVYPSDAVNRLVVLLNKEKPQNIIAHSHGSQILLNALNLIKRKTLHNIQWIRTYGARVPISTSIKDHTIDVLNNYNEKDWVYKLILRLGLIPQELKKLPRNKPVEYDSIRYEFIESSAKIKSYDITENNTDMSHNPEKRQFNFDDNTDAHKIACYSEKIKSDLKLLSGQVFVE
jgi:hypothetical protein